MSEHQPQAPTTTAAPPDAVSPIDLAPTESAPIDSSVPAEHLNRTPPSGVAPAAVPARAPHGGHAHLIFPGILETTASLLSIVVLALFVLTFIVQPFRIPSESMERTLLVGDFLLVNKEIYSPAGHWAPALPYREVQRGDIVVFHFPLDPTDHVVKRVIGLPGDRIHLEHGRVYVNNDQIHEPYVVYEDAPPDSFRDDFPATIYTDPGVDPQWWIQMRGEVRNGDLIVPQGKYFVLGDNRNHSRDSRYWGFVPRENIVGRPFVIYFSLRQPSTTDIAPPPDDATDDRLGHVTDSTNALGFARWNRMFRVVK